MVREQYLKDYAEKIYRRTEGYSFEKVIDLFPSLYIRIKYYYDALKYEEFQESFKHLFVIFKARAYEINKSLRDDFELYHLFFQKQAFLEQSGAPEKELDLETIDFLKQQNEKYKQLTGAYKAWLEEAKYYGVYDYVKPKIEAKLLEIKESYNSNRYMIYRLEQNFKGE